MPETSLTLTSDVLLSADGAAPAASGGFDWFGIVLMIGAMGAIMYFLVYRPQQKERAARESLLTGLVKGDQVVTTGGMHGLVVEVEGSLLKIDLGNKMIVTVDKEAVVRKAGTPAPAPTPAKG